jgi:hypothetical protein
LIRVGYVPHSAALVHPADRRRLLIWAKEFNVELDVDSPLSSDVLVLSGAANFGYWLKQATQPVILDLVDGYLGENPRLYKDFIRNILRSFRGTSSLKWFTYTRHLKRACEISYAVVVASPEQRELILPYNSNVYVILDDHSELSEKTLNVTATTDSNRVAPSKPYLFWEGYGYTLKHFRFIAQELDKFLSTKGWGMYVVTTPTFSRWGGYLGKVSTENRIKKWFPLSWQLIQIIPWTLENLVSTAAKSRIAIIPIDPWDKFAQKKSENKLLSMWKLGLPTIFSNTPAYRRVAEFANNTSSCVNPDEWREKLEELNDKESMSDVLAKAAEYVTDTHTHESLVQKWDDLIIGAVRNRL